MRRYKNVEDNKLEKVICNKCGKELAVQNGYLKEGCFTVDYVFGYFSKQDGNRHCFDLCEECYNEWIFAMKVPVEISQENELL